MFFCSLSNQKKNSNLPIPNFVSHFRSDDKFQMECSNPIKVNSPTLGLSVKS